MPEQNNHSDIIQEIDEVVKTRELELNRARRNCLYSFFFCIPLLVIALFFRDKDYSNYIMWLLASPVVIFFGKQFFIKASKNILRLRMNTDTLVALSTGTAYLISTLNTFHPSFWSDKGLHPHVYYAVSAVILTSVLLGRYLEIKARKNVESAIKQLIGLQPYTATLIKNGQKITIPIREIQGGNLLFVKPGEKIPADGKITQGSTFIDESMINGEATPTEKSENKKVYAGTINETSPFYFEVYKTGRETLLGQTVKMIQEGQKHRNRIVQEIDKVSSIFIIVIGIIAISTLLFWSLSDADNGINQGLSAMITVLIMACPCALGLATPLAIKAGIDNGSANGILIKGQEALEYADKLTSIVLDKTGTITEGVFKVRRMEWLSPQTTELTSIFYTMEAHSEHPISKALRQFLKDETRTDIPIEVSGISGHGLYGEVGLQKYYIGTHRLIDSLGIPISNEIQKWIEKESEGPAKIILFANESRLLAAASVSDSVKPTSQNAISKMRQFGLNLHILTGDSKNSAEDVAKEVGIDTNNILAGALPSGKAAYVKKLREEGEVVAMTGDGINDTGAMAMADVSFAMGKGSDIAMEVAQVTIASSDLNKVIQTINLSKATKRTIRQNIFWTFIYNIIGIVIATGIIHSLDRLTASPFIAGVIIILSTGSVALNSLLLKRRTI